MQTVLLSLLSSRSSPHPSPPTTPLLRLLLLRGVSHLIILYCLPGQRWVKPREHHVIHKICGTSTGIITRTNVCGYDRQRSILISNQRLTVCSGLRRKMKKRQKLHQQISHALIIASELFFHMCLDSRTVPTPLPRQTDLWESLLSSQRLLKCHFYTYLCSQHIIHTA